MFSYNVSNDSNNVIMNVETEVSPIKKFSDAYTVQTDWDYVSHVDNNGTQISNVPPFLTKACGIFEMTTTIKITNNSSQNINYSSLIFMNSLFGTNREHIYSDGSTFLSYGNLNFVALSNDTIITTYISDNLSNISYDSYPISNDNVNLFDVSNPHYARTTNTVVIKSKIYVMNCEIDTIPIDVILSGKVGSLVRCSNHCISQKDLPLYINEKIDLVYSYDC